MDLSPPTQPITPPVPQVAPPPASEDGAETKMATDISSDFDTFLQMLTAQIQNQDPLEPMKSEEFAVQLATFSGVEQQVRTNELLQAMAGGQDGSGLAQLANWIGREARAEMPALFDGAPVTFAPRQPAAGDLHQIVVTNAAGDEVWRRTIDEAAPPVEWDGQVAGGGMAPVGLYSAKVESFEAGEVVATEPAQVYGRVTEARSGPDGGVLVLEGGATVPVKDVTAVREAQAAF